jgi:arginyl-tRNA synthetase
MQDQLKKIVLEQQILINNYQKINAEQNEHFKNFTTVMMHTVKEKDKEINIQHEKYKNLETSIIQQFSKTQTMIDRLAEEKLVTEIGPKCNLCKKVNVTDKYKVSQKWKTRCNSCLSKSRTFEANTKRKRLCQENNVPFVK